MPAELACGIECVATNVGAVVKSPEGKSDGDIRTAIAKWKRGRFERGSEVPVKAVEETPVLQRPPKLSRVNYSGAIQKGNIQGQTRKKAGITGLSYHSSHV